MRILLLALALLIAAVPSVSAASVYANPNETRGSCSASNSTYSNSYDDGTYYGWDNYYSWQESCSQRSSVLRAGAEDGSSTVAEVDAGSSWASSSSGGWSDSGNGYRYDCGGTCYYRQQSSNRGSGTYGEGSSVSDIRVTTAATGTNSVETARCADSYSSSSSGSDSSASYSDSYTSQFARDSYARDGGQWWGGCSNGLYLDGNGVDVQRCTNQGSYSGEWRSYENSYGDTSGGWSNYRRSSSYASNSDDGRCETGPQTAGSKVLLVRCWSSGNGDGRSSSESASDSYGGGWAYASNASSAWTAAECRYGPTASQGVSGTGTPADGSWVMVDGGYMTWDATSCWAYDGVGDCVVYKDREVFAGAAAYVPGVGTFSNGGAFDFADPSVLP